jgi:hypothetical protein
MAKPVSVGRRADGLATGNGSAAVSRTGDYAGAVFARSSLAVIATVAATGLFVCGPAVALPPGPPTVSTSRVHLEALTVAAPAPNAGYSREQFGRGWASLGEGCDVRERVLIRDGRNVKVAKQCRPTSGRWRSIYDGKIIRRPGLIDIDHVVLLAEAWRSGAAAWSADQRERFANHLVDSQLIAVSASSNRSKGDQDPAEWKPPRRVTWCLYSRYWIQVKTTWKLTIDEVEKRAVAGMLDTCRRRR